MALDKSIISGKEHRKHYRGAKAVDASCRNHGGCPWCRDNRIFHVRKQKYAIQDRLNEYQKDPDKFCPENTPYK